MSVSDYSYGMGCSFWKGWCDLSYSLPTREQQHRKAFDAGEVLSAELGQIATKKDESTRGVPL